MHNHVANNMKKQILILAILILNSNFIFSQDIISELNGFKLRQFKEAVKNEYKEPLQVNNFELYFWSWNIWNYLLLFNISTFMKKILWLTTYKKNC